jgi:hypothetical protein
LLNNFYF